MPYVTKTRQVKRTLFQRLFSKPWLKKYKTEEYVEFEADVTLKSKYFPRRVDIYVPPAPPRLYDANNARFVERRIVQEDSSPDDFVSGVMTGVLMDELLRSSSDSFATAPSPAPFVSDGGGDFGGGGAGGSWTDSGSSYSDTSSSSYDNSASSYDSGSSYDSSSSFSSDW